MKAKGFFHLHFKHTFLLRSIMCSGCADTRFLLWQRFRPLTSRRAITAYIMNLHDHMGLPS